MLELANGAIYLDAGDILPHSCPICHSAIAYTKAITITCTSCGHHGPHTDFNCQWSYKEPN